MRTFSQFVENIFDTYKIQDGILRKLGEKSYIAALGGEENADKLKLAVQQWNNDFQNHKVAEYHWTQFLLDTDKFINNASYENQGPIGKMLSRFLMAVLPPH